MIRRGAARRRGRFSRRRAAHTRFICSALNLSRSKGMQQRGQQVTERKGQIDSAGGSRARPRRRRRGLSCCSQPLFDPLSAPARCSGAPGRRILPDQHAWRQDPHARRTARRQTQRARCRSCRNRRHPRLMCQAALTARVYRRGRRSAPGTGRARAAALRVRLSFFPCRQGPKALFGKPSACVVDNSSTLCKHPIQYQVREKVWLL
jgi:hypothetical protein